jgi:myo-inositol-1(or 4)-monophosphatase
LSAETYDKELNGAVSVAHLAGSIMLRYYDLDYEVSQKAGDTPAASIVTEVDVTIDHLVRDYFTRVWPDDQLLTEETDPEACWYQGRRIWTVDPIDGTMGYSQRTGSFGVSIALIEEGRPVLGVLYAPAKNWLAWAVAGEGAYLNGVPIDLSERKAVDTIVVSSNSIDLPSYQDALGVLNPDGRLGVIATESVVVKALLLLQGDGEIYPILPKSQTGTPHCKFWDIAGADVILHEAGAKVTDFAGEPYRYDRPEFRCIEGILMGTAAGHRYALSKLAPDEV